MTNQKDKYILALEEYSYRLRGQLINASNMLEGERMRRRFSLRDGHIKEMDSINQMISESKPKLLKGTKSNNQPMSDHDMSLSLAQLIYPDRVWYLTDRYISDDLNCVSDLDSDRNFQFDTFDYRERLGDMCKWWANNYSDQCRESGLVNILQSQGPERELARTILSHMTVDK